MKFARHNLNRYQLVLFMLIAPAPLASAQPQPQRRGLPAPTESILPSGTVEIPMHRFNRLPAVDAHINGRGPFRLIVDTGAAGVILKDELAAKLELKSPPGMPSGAAQVKIASPANKNIPARLVHIESMAFGEAEFRGIWTVATELPFGDNLDGIIGMNIFQKCLLTYDYPGRQIRLAQGSLPKANQRDILSFSTPGHSDSHPSIELDAGGKLTPFLIDTGMQGWFEFPHERAVEIGMETGPVDGPVAHFVGGSRIRQVARLQGRFGFGQYTVDHPIVFLNDDNGDTSPGTGMVLGTMVLEHFVVTFDIQNKLVQLARSSTAAIIPPAMRELGISLRVNNQNMEVWDVHPESHAASLGIAKGDTIHKIDGRSVAKFYGTSGWYDLLQSAEMIELQYSPGGAGLERTVQIQVLELLPDVTQKGRHSRSIRGSQMNASEFSPETLRRGAGAYETGKCAKCHGDKGAGTQRAPDLTDDKWLHTDGSIDSIRKILQTGVPRNRLKDPNRRFAMNPATKLIADDEAIDALAVYVASLKMK